MSVVHVKRDGVWSDKWPVPAVVVTCPGRDNHRQILTNHVEDMLGADKEMSAEAAWSSVVGWGISRRIEGNGP